MKMSKDDHGLHYIFNSIKIKIEIEQENLVSSKIINIRKAKFELFNKNTEEVLKQKIEQKSQNSQNMLENIKKMSQGLEPKLTPPLQGKTVLSQPKEKPNSNSFQ